MHHLRLVAILLWFSGAMKCPAQKPNTLNFSEKQAGWILLFDGKTTQGWRGAYSSGFPKYGWIVKDGELRGELSTGAESGDAGDIVTLKKYRNFEMVFDWKLGRGGNSGVKYFIEERRQGLEAFITKIAAHPLAQNERALHVFLLEPEIDLNKYVRGKIKH